MKKIVAMITLGALCMLALSTVGVSAQTTDPVAVVDAYRTAIGNNVEAALALVADDAVVNVVPPPPGTTGLWTGKEQIRQHLEFTVMQNAVHERKGDAQVDGDKVTMTVMILNNNFRKWGTGPVEHTYEAVVQGGKIKSIVVTMIVAERARVGAAAQQYQATESVAVVDAYIAATGNPEAQLSLVTDDITLRIEPPPPGTTGVWSGKAEAQGFFEFSKSQNVQLERVGSWQVSGNNVTGTVMVTVNDFVKWNVGAVQHQYEFTVQGGKIKSFTSIMAPSERGRVAAAAQAYMAAQGGQPPAGMPRTGGEQTVSFLQLVALGMLTVLVGLGLRRTVRSYIQ